MRRPFGSGRSAPSKRVQAMLLGAQDRLTLRIMLGNGGQVSVHGDRATVTMPTGGARSFPAAMVREVQADG